jgi:hypothetical protein
MIYSCVTGNYDDVTKGLLASTAPAEKNVIYVLYTDQFLKNAVKVSSDCFQYQAPNGNILWQIRPLIWSHPLCKRRTARFCKINPHIFCDADIDYTIWLDGSQKIKEDVRLTDALIPTLKNNFLSTFKHPSRICIYQELQACIQLKKDNATLMKQQIENYRKEGYPAYNGLVETACIVRKQNKESADLNNHWWKEITNNSYRDQLSFNYVVWKYVQKYGLIPGHRLKSAFFNYAPHLKKKI